MAIREHDLFHGAVIARFMREEPQAVRLIETSSAERSVYSIEGLAGRPSACAIYIKHSTNPYESKRDEGAQWQFTFMREHLRQIADLCDRGECLIVLVCGDRDVKEAPFETCVLTGSEVKVLLNINSNKSEGIKVVLRRGNSFRVHGKNGTGEKPLVIPRNRIDQVLRGPIE